MNKVIFKKFNKETRKHETVNLNQIRTGQTVIKMHWCQSAQTYVTIPGDCTYFLNEYGQLQLDED